MKRIAAAAIMAAVAGLAACNKAETAAGDSTSTEATMAATAEPATGDVAAAPVAPPAPAAEPIVAGAPAFAVLYPGGTIETPATTATGAAGPGGLVTFRTEADPEAVIAFYRSHAEAAGLASVMAMNMGEARSYGAAKNGAGANLQVVASPTESGETSVQLSWSAGQ